MKKYFKRFKDNMAKEYKRKPTLYKIFFILRFIVIVALVRQALLRNYEHVFLCALTLLLMFAPYFLESVFHISLPEVLEIILLIFIFAAEILGEVHSFFTKIPHFDTMLHTISGFLIATLGFSLVYLLNESSRVTMKLSPLFLTIVGFCVAMTVGVLWEFFEFSMDVLFASDMQKDTVINNINTVLINPQGLNDVVSITNIKEVVIDGVKLPVNGYIDIGLIDTMKDLFADLVGSLSFSILAYVYLKGEKREMFFEKMVTKMNYDPDYDKVGFKKK